MHRLFVPECLKRQRNLSPGEFAPWPLIMGPVASFAAAFMQQFCCKNSKTSPFRDGLLENIYLFQILMWQPATRTIFRHAAPLLQQSLQHDRHEKGGPLARGALPQTPAWTDQVFIESKNSELFLVLRSLSSRKSIASMVPIGLRIRRSTYIFLSSCGSVMSSSLRVPEREMSIAGKVRLSETLRSRISSELPVPLNSSKITSSMRLPVSTSAVAMIVSEPPSSILRAAPKKRFGRCSALASTPPVSTLPDDGTTVL